MSDDALATREQQEQLLLDSDAFDHLNILEDDPMKRMQQIQRCRLHLVKQKKDGISDELSRELDRIAKTDLGILRLDVEREGGAAVAEVAKALGELFGKGIGDPSRATGDISPREAPVVPDDVLGDKEVLPESLSQELANITFEDLK